MKTAPMLCLSHKHEPKHPDWRAILQLKVTTIRTLIGVVQTTEMVLSMDANGVLAAVAALITNWLLIKSYEHEIKILAEKKNCKK